MFSKFKSAVLFLFALSVAVPVSPQAALIPTAATITVGNRVFTDLTNLIILHCYASSNGGCTGRKGTSSSGYQVTAGKTLTIQAFRTTCGAGAATNAITIAQSDNDIGMDSATALTNPLYLAGAASSKVLVIPNSTGSGTPPVIEYALSFPVAATKYFTVGVLPSGWTCQYEAFGYEA